MLAAPCGHVRLPSLAERICSLREVLLQPTPPDGSFSMWAKARAETHMTPHAALRHSMQFYMYAILCNPVPSCHSNGVSRPHFTAAIPPSSGQITFELPGQETRRSFKGPADRAIKRFSLLTGSSPTRANGDQSAALGLLRRDACCAWLCRLGAAPIDSPPFGGPQSSESLG